jgi:creatinine amidohydrolase
LIPEQVALDACRLELLRPDEIAARLALRPVVYLPIGTLEFHGGHLPIGLDALNAHEICLRAAARGGGVVYPALYYGTGGTHGGYPWTITMPAGDEIRALLDRSLARLGELGVRLAVLFTGHFPVEQIAIVEEAAAAWNAGGRGMLALGLSLSNVEGALLAPDHAGRFETTLLQAHLPGRVALARLPARDPEDGPDGPFGPARNDPAHPLWGVVGPDPRQADPAEGPALLDACVSWVLAKADGALPA